MGWPEFIARGWEIDPGKVVKVGDVVTISLGVRRERYVISLIHDDGLCDLLKEGAA